MRNLKCHCCPSGRVPNLPQWVIFDGIHICQDCRMLVIHYWKDVLGLGLGDHVFLDEFMVVESNRPAKESS